MIDMTAHINRAASARVEKAIDRMIRETNLTGKQAVHRASYHFVVSAKAQTPKARKKMRTLQTKNDSGAVETWKMVDGERVLARTSKPSRYYVVQRQGKPPMIILMPNPDFAQGREQKRDAREVFAMLKQKYKYKPHMRAAKNSWNKAFRDLGKSVANTMEKRNAAVQAASRAQKLGGDFTPSIRITNNLSYLPTIAPNLEATSMRSASKKLMKLVEKGIEKQIKRF